MNGKSLLNATHHRAVEVLKEIENEADFVVTRLVDPVKDETLTRTNSNTTNNKAVTNNNKAVINNNKNTQDGNATLKAHSLERGMNVGFDNFSMFVNVSN